MGIVYKAHDTRLDRTVAIKVLHESSADLRQRMITCRRATCYVLTCLDATGLRAASG
jgi:serine/threonine protein kinase